MRKSIKDPASVSELITRINNLQVTNSALWGMMEVTEMLHHCSKAVRATLDATTSTTPSNIKQRALRFLFLNVIDKYPKNAKAPSKVKVERISKDRFEVEKQKLTDLLNEYLQHEKVIEAKHPVFGNLNDKQWGILTWMHLDHHLRQFGV